MMMCLEEGEDDIPLFVVVVAAAVAVVVMRDGGE